jgi:opacity protein-like surface antigen
MPRKIQLSVLLFVSTTALATTNQLDFNFGRGTPQSYIQAGGSSDHAGSRGTNWSADFLHQNGPHTYIGLGGGQFRSNDNVSETFVPNASSTIRSKTSSILLLTRVDIPSRSRIVMYVLAGVGWARNSLSITAMPGQIALLEQSKDCLAYASGIGADYALSDRLFIGVEARYQGSFRRTYDLTPAGTTLTGVNSMDTSMNVILLGVKVGIKY